MTTSSAPFTIRELDLLNDADLTTLHELEQSRLTFTERGEHGDTFEDFAHIMRDDVASRSLAWGAFQDGHAVGFAMAHLSDTDEDSNPEALVTAHAASPATADDVTDALLERAEREIPDTHPAVVWTVTYPHHDGTPPHIQKVAHERGYTPDTAITLCELSLPLSPQQQETLRQAVEAQASDTPYRIETYVGGVPAQHREAVCAITSQAEQEEEPSFHTDPLTPEDYAEELSDDAVCGWQRVETIALDHHNTVVGVTRVDGGIEAPDDPLVHNFTYVLEPHRGHRLGLALNLACLTEVEKTWPQHTTVVAESNNAHTHTQAMLHRLGYVPQRVEASLRKQR